MSLIRDMGKKIMKEIDAFIISFFLNEAEYIEGQLAGLIDMQKSKDILELIRSYSHTYQRKIDLYRNIRTHMSKQSQKLVEKIFKTQKEYFQDYLLFYMGAPTYPMRQAFHNTQPDLHHDVPEKILRYCSETIEQFRHNLVQSADLFSSNLKRYECFETLCLCQKKLDAKIVSEKIRLQSMQKLANIPEESKLHLNPQIFKQIQTLKSELAEAKLQLIRTLDLTKIEQSLFAHSAR